MTLFSACPGPPSSRRRSWVGPAVLVTGIALVAGLGITPAPYVIEQPGPVYNTLGSNNDVPLISIPDHVTYPTSGSLDMLTVSIVGDPDGVSSWLDVARAWFDPTKAVVPVEQVFPRSISLQQRDEQSQVQMTNSQQEAIAAALRTLGYQVTQHAAVGQVLDGSPAAGVLDADDVVLAINGAPVTDGSAVRSAVQEAGTQRPVRLTIERKNDKREVEINAVERDGVPVIGIVIKVTFDFPFAVNIRLDKVGGPSAGMMFALGIIDKITDGQLTGGAAVAGTGTIDAVGAVGPIGGIRQKLYGAKDAGARYFLAPADNCNEVVGHVPDGIDVLKVSTLTEALAALKGIASGDISSLPTCSGTKPVN
ncbi:YlbL family protein [Rathayibacter toxicus]|uniref:endopeptidase La n=1 Tax=Rathayibacter toxicus TaxID=145458 RepID=A0A0C5BDL5_9MICO|nr:ATP-dependent serine peptidase containing a PDZ domain protein [Rathayibacter toxicus]ALS56783.1 ATP-dependent serine peptidase containing a PDZ domain protein [Rathayibacter toxicus]KKM46371.1 ATP-dependent serine peptidase containing a PDZ domain protein [Rathayibacter toxicus]